MDEDTMCIVIAIIAVIILFCFMFYPAIEMGEKCEALSIKEGADSFRVTTEPVCILSFCETRTINNNTFLQNCREEEWRLKP